MCNAANVETVGWSSQLNQNFLLFLLIFLLPKGIYFMANIMKVVVYEGKLIHYHIALLVLEVVLHTLGSRHINLFAR